MKRTIAFFAAVLLLLTLVPTGVALAEGESLTVLFTTDIHSNDVMHLTAIDGEGVRLGGFSRLKTAVSENWVEGSTILVDSGDFSMGTLYQTFTESDALELRLMAEIGYDAVALGNHDFEIGEDGLRDELRAFRAAGGGFPLLCSNLTDERGGLTEERDNNPLINEGVQNYTVIERNGLRIGVFALMGKDAISYTPVTTFKFSDPIKAAKTIVNKLRTDEKADIVIALSHAGTMPDGSFTEDADIAAAVEGIDVILSGHEHVPLPELIYSNGTMIAGAGTAINHLGKLTLSREGAGWKGEYELIPVTDAFAADAEIEKTLLPYSQRLKTDYLEPMGVEHDLTDVVGYSPYDFMDGDHMSLELKNYAFAKLMTDGYFYALENEGITDVDAVFIPTGFVRAGLYAGELTFMDIYNVLSYGISPIDGSCGAPICCLYVTGSELYDLCETSVSLSGLMNTVQMLIGGMRFAYDESRLILNRVYYVETLNRETGEYEPVERNDNRLYKLAVSWTALQNIALLKSSSYGLLSVEPKDADGHVYTADEFESTVAHRKNGAELKEWYSLYSYISSMEKDETGISQIGEEYGQEPEYMKNAGGFLNFFRNPGRVFWIVAAVLAVIILLVALLIRFIVRRVRRARRKSIA